MSTYEYVEGIHKSPSAMVPCTDCYTVMSGIFSRGVRHTCTPCGGSALKDSRESLLRIRQARIDERRAAQNERLESA